MDNEERLKMFVRTIESGAVFDRSKIDSALPVLDYFLENYDCEKDAIVAVVRARYKLKETRELLGKMKKGKEIENPRFYPLFLKVFEEAQLHLWRILDIEVDEEELIYNWINGAIDWWKEQYNVLREIQQAIEEEEEQYKHRIRITREGEQS